MMNQVPTDVLRLILSFLSNDVCSVCRFEATCQSHQRIVRNDHELWESILATRWTKGRWKDDSEDNDDGGSDVREKVKYRSCLDAKAKSCVLEMAHDLRSELGEHAVSAEQFHHAGDGWDHPQWNVVLQMKNQVYDVLKSMANASVDYGNQNNKDILHQNLERFLAARALVSLHTLDCLHEWASISLTEPIEDNRDQVTERFALLAVRAQMTPPELLSETIPVELVLSNKLDTIANECHDEVNEAQYMVDKVRTLNRILFEEMGFRGNEEDYYDYKNSLLNHVLITKKGIPITLCILYTCISRRLGMKVDMIGLPGHLILGFYDDVMERQRYLDVFHGGRILDIDDCVGIAAAYGYEWQPSFVSPLDPYQVFTRILNNLSNCHARPEPRTPSSVLRFRDVLSFSERALTLFHRQPRIAFSLLENFSQHLSLTMSPELMMLYGLISTDEEQ